MEEVGKKAYFFTAKVTDTAENVVGEVEKEVYIKKVNRVARWQRYPLFTFLKKTIPSQISPQPLFLAYLQYTKHTPLSSNLKGKYANLCLVAKQKGLFFAQEN